MNEQKAREAGIADRAKVKEALQRSTDRLTEVICELVRLSWFPDHPSRFAIVFGYRCIKDAKAARIDHFGNESARIWTVEAERSFEADSGWLDLSGDVTAAIARACGYWSGKRRAGWPPHTFESLLIPPVTVIAPVS